MREVPNKCYMFKHLHCAYPLHSGLKKVNALLLTPYLLHGGHYMKN